MTPSEPLSALVPVQPLEAAQEVASVEDHVNVEDCPRLTVVGAAERETIGAGTGGGGGGVVPPPDPTVTELLVTALVYPPLRR